MKRVSLFLVLIVLFLFVGCFEPKQEGIPLWLTTYISECETDTMNNIYYNTVEIWQYEYNDDIVFYFRSGGNDFYNWLYDYNGNLLGAPDGGWSGSGDGSITDWTSRSNGLLIWQNGVSPNLSVTEDYDIISAVLQNIYPDSTFIHIVENTLYASHYRTVAERLSDYGYFSQLMLSAYAFKNDSTFFWNSDSMPTAVELFSQESFDTIFNGNDSWTRYYQTYPESFGYFRFSRPALDPAGTTAIVEYNRESGGWSGGGTVVVLEKQQDQWTVVLRVTTWVH